MSGLCPSLCRVLRFLICSRFQLNGFLFFVVILFVLPSSAIAQSSDDVHIIPREKSAASTDGSDLAVRMKPLRVDVNLVLVPVTVTDVKNKPVTDLAKENFRLFEEKRSRRSRISLLKTLAFR